MLAEIHVKHVHVNKIQLLIVEVFQTGLISEKSNLQREKNFLENSPPFDRIELLSLNTGVTPFYT